LPHLFLGLSTIYAQSTTPRPEKRIIVTEDLELEEDEDDCDVAEGGLAEELQVN
jgi:hypothetical protein